MVQRMPQPHSGAHETHGRVVVDPVCGMEMGAGEAAARLTLDGREQSFCSDECLRLYVASPERY